MGDLPASMLAEVSRTIEERAGLAFPPEKWPDLRKGLESASESLGLPGVLDLAESLLSSSPSPEWMTVLYDHLTIGETYFFREPDILEALEKQLLPGLIRERRNGSRELRVWSAGCSTGEEPYSLAMLLCLLIPDIDQWDVSVLATDLNTASLRKAKEGIYTAWSFRGTPDWVRKSFFRRSGEGGHSVTPKVRKLVRFEHLNLGTDVFPALWNGTVDLDLILCRNVLMYFSPERVDSVLHRFYEALRPGGYLLVSANELSIGRFEGFERAEHGRAFFHRKPSASPGKAVPGASSGKIDLSRRHSKAVSVGSPPPSHRAACVRSRPPAPPTVSAPADAGRTGPETDSCDPLEAARRAADGGSLEEALRLCRTSLEEDEMNPAAHYLHAVILRETGQWREAARELKRVIYLDPEFVTAYVLLGHILRTEGNRPEADRQFSIALSLLDRYKDGDVVPESGGTMAGALAAMIRAIGRSEDVSGDRSGA